MVFKNTRRWTAASILVVLIIFLVKGYADAESHIDYHDHDYGQSHDHNEHEHEHEHEHDKEHAQQAASKYKIVCYYTNWSQYRDKPYFPENIDPTLCTHIIFAFAKINKDSELEAYEWNDLSTAWSKGMYERTVALKSVNKDLKVMLAVGGWNHNSKPFSIMATNDVLRANFIQKTVKFLKDHHLDGLDLDWEYPANRDTEDRPEDKFYFTLLCKELSVAFKPHHFLLSAAVAAGFKYIRSSYEIAEIDKYLDFISIMAYDMHGSWDNVTGHNAPLYRHRTDKDKNLNIDSAVKLWLTGVSKEKLILGLSAYGRSFKIKPGFESCPLTDTPNDGAGTKGFFTKEDGFLSYYEVCQKIKTKNWTYVWSEDQQVPFAISNELIDTHAPMEWVGFDDVRSFEIKVKYIMNLGLGGAMLWSLDMDDFLGIWCDQGKYPLLKVVNSYLNPKLKLQMPDPSVLYKKPEGAEKSSKNFTYETDYYEMSSKHDDEASSQYFNTFNMFQSSESNEIQIYKFCQCKKGKHTVKLDKNPDSQNFMNIDCNLKRILSDDEVHQYKPDNHHETHDDHVKKQNNGGFIFNLDRMFRGSAPKQSNSGALAIFMNALFLIWALI